MFPPEGNLLTGCFLNQQHYNVFSLGRKNRAFVISEKLDKHRPWTFPKEDHLGFGIKALNAQQLQHRSACFALRRKCFAFNKMYSSKSRKHCWAAFTVSTASWSVSIWRPNIGDRHSEVTLLSFLLNLSLISHCSTHNIECGFCSTPRWWFIPVIMVCLMTETENKL